MALPRIFRALFARPDLVEPKPPLEAPPPPPPPRPIARNPELEAAITRDPDAPGPWLVYADWLQSQGDPRGEFITVQYTLSQTTDPDQLVELRALEKQMQEQWTAEIGPLQHAQLTWRLGHVMGARLSPAPSGRSDQPSLQEQLDSLLGHPSSAFLRSLTIGLPEDNGYQGIVDTLVARGPLPGLRELHLGDFAIQEEMEISWVEVGDLSQLWQALPGLRSLIVQGGGFQLGEIRAPGLTHLELRTGGMPREALEAVSRADLPALESLVLWMGDANYGAEVTPEDLAPLLQGRQLPRVRHLGLMNAEFTDALCEALVDAPILVRLRSLDLSMGTMGDTGGRIVLDHIDRFAHLEKLELDHQFLDQTRTGLGRHAFIHLGEQHPAPPEDRYVWVGE